MASRFQGSAPLCFGLLAVCFFTAKGAEPPNESPPLVMNEARRQAEVLHAAMHATLQLVHHRYYKEDEGLPIPAAVVDEIFQEIEVQQGIQLRWLVVEGQAMNDDHKPQTEFEHAAVAALKRGETTYEALHEGQYRHVGRITLTNHCLKCHVPDRKSTVDRTAGLMITIPVSQ